MSVPLVAAAALLDNLSAPTHLLAARRASHKSFPRTWEFPGGKVEPGETVAAAWHRELAEELSITAVRGPEVLPPTGESWPATSAFRLRLWLGEIRSGTLAMGPEHEELRWVPLAQAEDLDWLQPDRPLIAAVLAQVNQPNSSA